MLATTRQSKRTKAGYSSVRLRFYLKEGHSTALAHAQVPTFRAISLCLGHLDELALTAAAHALKAAGCTTGPTINDSLYVLVALTP